MRKTILCMMAALLFVLPFIYAEQVQGIDPLDPGVLNSLKSDARSLELSASKFYQEQQYLQAAKVYLELLKINPANSGALYNLACCYGLMGEASLASQALGMAYKAGFEDLSHIDGDPDFDPVRASAEYLAIRDSLDVWAARKAEREGQLDYYQVSSFLPYRVYLPPQYDPAKTYRLLIALHGFGDNAVNFGYIYDSIKDNDLIMVVPEAPYLLPNKDFQGFSWSPLVGPDNPIWEPAFTSLEDAIMELGWSLKEKYKPQSTWLMGFSQGSAYTLILGLRRPQCYDGLIAFGGWLETDVLDEATLTSAKQVPVFLAHGTQDRIIGYDQGAKAFETLKEIGYDVTLRSFEGGHLVDRESLKAGLEWLSARK